MRADGRMRAIKFAGHLELQGRGGQ